MANTSQHLQVLAATRMVESRRDGQRARRVRAGTVTLIDVRPAAVVAYCRGPYCVYALQAVAALRKRGLRAMCSDAGVSEWRAAGRPVESA